jgi:sterol desaturase/sphingolipid hydroxylase (fatty acid hydroxylase superfamily)
LLEAKEDLGSFCCYIYSFFLVLFFVFLFCLVVKIIKTQPIFLDKKVWRSFTSCLVEILEVLWEVLSFGAAGAGAK